MLHATVVDDSQRIVTNLDTECFHGLRRRQAAEHQILPPQDIPVAMGIVIDNSGSMREKRAKVNQAALNLVRSSNPKDQVFVVNFNDENILDQDFTSTSSEAEGSAGKNRISRRYGDVRRRSRVGGPSEAKRPVWRRKLLFVVTDGEDNASRESLEQAVKPLQEENGPTVYAIGILGDEEHPRRAKKRLRRTLPSARAESPSFPRPWTKWTRSAAPSPMTSATSTPSATNRQLPKAREASAKFASKPKPKAMASW